MRNTREEEFGRMQYEAEYEKFKKDHPIDPRDKSLFAESSDSSISASQITNETGPQVQSQGEVP